MTRLDAPIYLDYAASTPPSEEVIDAMLPWLRSAHGNPHSEHWHGRRAAAAIENARADVADLIGASPREIIFTSGATEANNLALKGMLSGSSLRRQLWLSDLEHKSLREPARILATAGVHVHSLTASSSGRIDLDTFAHELDRYDAAPGLIAVGHGNNEIGTLQPIMDIAEYVHARGHVLHVDASQSAGRVPLNVDETGCDLLCMSSHKLYGPGGIGALYIAAELQHELQPQIHGGGQERGLRSGTIPTFLAVGFGTAASIARQALSEAQLHQVQLVERFLATLREHGLAYLLIGHSEQRLPGHASLRFPGVDAEDLLAMLAPSLSASTGSACAAGELRSSPVLRSLGLDEQAASEVVRFTFGRMSSLENAYRAAALVALAADRIRARNGTFKS